MMMLLILTTFVFMMSSIAHIQACDAGSAPVNGVCTFCPAGSYALAGANSCTKCPSGYWAPINSVSKDACYPKANSHAASISCPPGSAPVNGVCTFCPPGTYALADAQSCTHCPNGFWAPINSVSPDACYPRVNFESVPVHCDAGSVPVKGICTFCPPGSYALAGSQICSHCPTGFWAPINSVSKDACYPRSNFATNALHCDAGSAPHDGVCDFCPPGTYALAGAEWCTDCPCGFWAPNNSVSPDACYPLPGHTCLRQ